MLKMKLMTTSRSAVLQLHYFSMLVVLCRFGKRNKVNPQTALKLVPLQSYTWFPECIKTPWYKKFKVKILISRESGLP